MVDQFMEGYEIVNNQTIFRLLRIARCFKPTFTVRGQNIFVYSEDKSFIAKIGFEKLEPDFPMKSMIVDVSNRCAGADTKYLEELACSLDLLAMLDDLWPKIESIECPICLSTLPVHNNQDLDIKDVEGRYVLKMLKDHVEAMHDNVLVHGFRNDGFNVFLRTTLGDFEVPGHHFF